jgi:hypothetical protein
MLSITCFIKVISKVKIKNKIVSFIPTPLNYADGAKDINNIINKIAKLSEKNYEFKSIRDASVS